MEHIPIESKIHQTRKSELQHFIKCLLEDLAPSPSSEDGLKNLISNLQACENKIKLNKKP